MAQELLAGQAFPGCFTGGKHTADGGDNEAEECESSDNVPPMSIINQHNDPGVEQRVNNCREAGDGTDDRADHENGHWENAVKME